MFANVHMHMYGDTGRFCYLNIPTLPILLLRFHFKSNCSVKRFEEHVQQHRRIDFQLPQCVTLFVMLRCFTTKVVRMFTTNKEAAMKINLQNVVHYVSTCNSKQMNIFPQVWYQYSLGVFHQPAHPHGELF